jgi:hypothetical protein
MSSVYNEQDNTGDKVKLVSCTDSVLTVKLANDATHTHYELSESNDLALELQSEQATLTLAFEAGGEWPSGARVKVVLDGVSHHAPCEFERVATGSSFSITVEVPSQSQTLALLKWDPKILVIAPTRTGSGGKH